jgi:hypothetical protein
MSFAVPDERHVCSYEARWVFFVSLRLGIFDELGDDFGGSLPLSDAEKLIGVPRPLGPGAEIGPVAHDHTGAYCVD